MKRIERNTFNGLRRGVNEGTIYVEIPVDWTHEGRQGIHEMLTVEKDMAAVCIGPNLDGIECIRYRPALHEKERQQQEGEDIDAIMQRLPRTDYTWNGYHRNAIKKTASNDSENASEEKKGEETMDTTKKTTTKKTGYKLDALRRALNTIDASAATPHISTTNSKLGCIPSLNLLPVVTCSASACKTCAKGGCYAVKNVFRCGYDVNKSSVLRAWTENTLLARNNLDMLERFLDHYLSGINPPRLFRIHSSGDFFSRAYAEMWFRIAEHHPETRFLAFTKQFDVIASMEKQFSALDNFSLVLSAWPGMDVPQALREVYPVAWLDDGTETRIPADAIKCPGKCETCGLCWNLKATGKDTYFAKH